MKTITKQILSIALLVLMMPMHSQAAMQTLKTMAPQCLVKTFQRHPNLRYGLYAAGAFACWRLYRYVTKNRMASPIQTSLLHKTTQEFTLKEAHELTVSNMHGPIEVIGHDHPHKVILETTKKAMTKEEFDKLESVITATPTSLTVTTKYKPQLTVTAFGEVMVVPTANPKPCIRYKLFVPRAMLTSSFKNNERIDVRNLRGSVTAETSNASISIEDIEGNATARGNNTSIFLRNIGGFVDAKTAHKQILLMNIRGDVKAITSNGLIQVEDASKNITAKTSNAPLRIYLLRSIHGHRIDAKTSNSTIDLKRPMTYTLQSPTHIQGVTSTCYSLADSTEENAIITLETSNDSIRIY